MKFYTFAIDFNWSIDLILSSDECFSGTLIQIFNLDMLLSLLLFNNFLFLFFGNSLFGDLVEESENDGSEHKPEGDESVFSVAELNILDRFSEV